MDSPSRRTPRSRASGPGLAVALTIDDAPSTSEAGAVFDPGRMDAIREILRGAGVRHCVAFVIGSLARGHEEVLSRWLADGFELGNHGQHHRPASELDDAGFEAELEACDVVLASVGAFAGGRRRWFRLPYGDRGRDAAQRRAVRDTIERHGYAPVDVSIDLYDWCYEPSWTRAAGEDAVRRRILARFDTAARRELRHARARHPVPDWVDIAALHFGDVTVNGLARLLDREGEGLALRRLDDAVDQPVYRELLGDDRANGILASRLRSRGPGRRALRRASRLLRRLDWLAERRLGPIAPRWSA